MEQNFKSPNEPLAIDKYMVQEAIMEMEEPVFDTDMLRGKEKTGDQMNTIFNPPLKTHVQRKNESHNHRRKNTKVNHRVTPFAKETRMIGEIQPI